MIHAYQKFNKTLTILCDFNKILNYFTHKLYKSA